MWMDQVEMVDSLHYLNFIIALYYTTEAIFLENGKV